MFSSGFALVHHTSNTTRFWGKCESTITDACPIRSSASALCFCTASGLDRQLTYNAVHCYFLKMLVGWVGAQNAARRC
jgi:hypothetical protein